MDDRSEILIEGYPRSGNTFAVVAFEYAQQRPVRVAHHHHCAAQVLEAVRRSLPTVVLLRQPADASSSLLLRHPGLTARLVLNWYLAFYERLEVVQSSVVVAPFDLVISDFGAVIDEVNRRFGTGFLTFRHSEAAVREVRSRIEDYERVATDSDVDYNLRVPLPTEERRNAGAGAKQRIRAEEPDLLVACENVYARWVEECSVKA